MMHPSEVCAIAECAGAIFDILAQAEREEERWTIDALLRLPQLKRWPEEFKSQAIAQLLDGYVCRDGSILFPAEHLTSVEGNDIAAVLRHEFALYG